MGKFDHENASKVKRFLSACPVGHVTISRVSESGRLSVSNIPAGMVHIYTKQGWTVEAKPVQKVPEGVEPAKAEEPAKKTTGRKTGKGRTSTKKTSDA